MNSFVVAGCGLAVKGEGILALCCEVGVIPVQGPIAGLNSPLRFVLNLAHACLDAVVNAGCVSNDEDGPL